MKHTAKAALLIVLLALGPGCTTMVKDTGEWVEASVAGRGFPPGPLPYSGTFYVVDAIEKPSPELCCGAMGPRLGPDQTKRKGRRWALYLPFSLATDTAMLPISVPVFMFWVVAALAH